MITYFISIRQNMINGSKDFATIWYFPIFFSTNYLIIIIDRKEEYFAMNKNLEQITVIFIITYSITDISSNIRK